MGEFAKILERYNQAGPRNQDPSYLQLAAVLCLESNADLLAHFRKMRGQIIREWKAQLSPSQLGRLEQITDDVLQGGDGLPVLLWVGVFHLMEPR